MKEYGKKVWLIPDGYYEGASTASKSHDAVCVLNTTDTDAKISITLFFEDKAPIGGYEAVCGAMKTHHIRMDKLKNKDGVPVPVNTPYAILVESTVPVVCQYSRLVTAQPAMALMTTIAYPID